MMSSNNRRSNEHKNQIEISASNNDFDNLKKLENEIEDLMVNNSKDIDEGEDKSKTNQNDKSLLTIQQ